MGMAHVSQALTGLLDWHFTVGTITVGFVGGTGVSFRKRLPKPDAGTLPLRSCECERGLTGTRFPVGIGGGVQAKNLRREVCG